MLKNNLFIKKEYRNILLGVLLFYFLTVIGEFVDSTVAGQVLGEGAVAAVEIIASITFLYGGIALFIAVGFQILHSREMGKFDRVSASNVFSQAITVSILFGVITFILSEVFADEFLTVSGCSGELFNEAKEYYTFFPYVGLIYSLGYVVAYLGINDGDLKIIIFSSAGYVLSNILLSLVFVNLLGLKGLGLGTLVATVIQLMILCIHFFSKKNSIVKTGIRFDFSLTVEMLKYGFFALLGYVCIFAVDTVLHHFILTHYEEGYLTAYAIVNLFLDFAVIFEAFSEAGTAVAGVYVGEKNHVGVKLTMRVYLFSILMMGVVFTGVFTGGASLIPEIYAIRTPEFYEAAKMTSVIMGVSGMATALVYAPMNMYACLGHPHVGTMFSLLFNGVFPVALGIPLGLRFGYTGLVWGIALSPVATLIFAFLIMLILFGKKGFPYYLGKNEYQTNMYCMDSRKPESCRAALSRMADDLLADGEVTKQQSDLICSLLQKMADKIIESNRNPKVLIEISVMINDGTVRIITRDNGVLRNLNEHQQLFQDITDQAVLAESSDGDSVKHLITTSTNRNGFVLKK